MIEDLAEALSADLLFLICVGPSFGESVAIRVPPNEWVVIDSFSARRAALPPGGPTLTPIARLLQRMAAKVRVVALTHPHLDHCLGLHAIIDAHTTARVGSTGLWPDTSSETTVRDARAHTGTALRSLVLSTIKTRWEEQPDRALRLKMDERVAVTNEASLDVLFPDDQALREQEARGLFNDTNNASSPMLLTWDKARIVLGADLEDGWDRVI